MPIRSVSNRRAISSAAVSRWPRLANVRTPLPAGTLPRELTAFVGRLEDIAALTAQLFDGASLITLTGIGGVGKTRLALHTAGQVQASYASGARLVRLAQLPEGGQVSSTVLAGLGVRERPHATPAETLLEVLRDARLLLVLDNCEHVVQASAELVELLLQSCPGVHILATSREALSVPGERVFRVQPLASPGEGEAFATLVRSDAVELFAERARAAEPQFELTPTSGAVVARVCRLLDGIPLAIELAAARTQTLSVAEIYAHLADPLALLTLAPRTAPARQQTMRATIDWSYGLLAPDEQTLLRRLAVFIGGFTLEAANAVCTGDELPPGRVLDLLDRLVSKSLVIVLKGNEPTRYLLLETLRRYLFECLATAGEEDAVRARHRDWCIDVAERAPPELFDSEQIALVTNEQHNLRAALRWTLDSDQADSASRLGVGLAPLWMLRGPFAEGRAQLTAVSDLPSASTPSGHIARALAWASTLAFNEGAYVFGEDLAGRALGLAEAAGDEVAMVIALFQLGQMALGQGDLPHAAKRFEAALEFADSSVALAAINAIRLGEVMLELGNVSRAEELLAQGGTWSRAVNYRLTEGRLLAARALVAERAGNHSGADRLLAEAVAAERALGGMPGLTEVLTTSGLVFGDRGEPIRAADALNEALVNAASYGSPVRLAHVLEAVSGLVVDAHPEACVRMAAAANELRDSLRALARPSERQRLGKHLKQARRRLGEAGYGTVWRVASTTPLDAIVDEARTLLQHIGATNVKAPAPTGADSLSEREREVVLLVVRGLSNREIADELVVTRKTAEAHIGHILTKLGLSNRVQIATWAYDRGLAAPDTTAPATPSIG
jgi:predicted ATPase/DNA-binding CsgD family transcriptional regulator